MIPEPSTIPPLDDPDQSTPNLIGCSDRKHKNAKRRLVETPVPVSSKASSTQSKPRTKRACSRCKRRKIKCDGELPCSNCSKHTQLCDYNSQLPRNCVVTEDLRSRPVSLEQNKRSTQEYVKYLENRVMELKSSACTCAGVYPLENANCDEIFLKNHYQYSQNRYGILTKYHSILANELAKSVHATLTPQESKDLAVPRVQYYGWNMSGTHYLRQRALPPFDQLVDLVRDSRLCSWLIDFFLDRINPLFSFVHPRVFRDQYDNYMSIVSKETPSESTRLFNSILYLIFAVSIRFSEADPETPMDIKSMIYPTLEEKLFDSAYEVISKLSFEWQSFELIQSWVLVTLYLRATHRQNSSFGSLGTAIRMCKGMSLNLNIVVEAPSKHYEVTKAKRIFWLVYSWDKLYSYQSGKDFEIHDSTISLELPALASSSTDDWLEKPALAMIHLAKIAGQIQYHNLKRAGMDKEFLRNINDQLQVWRSWCDENLKHSDYESLLVDQIYLTYHDIVLSLYNKMLLKLLDCKLEFDGSIAHTTVLLAHSSEVLTMFDLIRGRNQLLIPWWLNLSLLFNVAIIDVTLINAGLYHEKCTLEFQKAMNLLTQLKDKAGMAEECIWTLKMVNHLCVLRFKKALKSLTDIGVDHGPNDVNKAKFLQFEKVEEKIQKHTDKKTLEFFKDPHIMDTSNIANGEFCYRDNIADFSNDLFASLTWFDQWAKEN